MLPGRQYEEGRKGERAKAGSGKQEAEGERSNGLEEARFQ